MGREEVGCASVVLVGMSVFTLVVLGLGVVAPLAGGSDMNSVPRTVGILLALLVWGAGLATAWSAGRRAWAGAILVLSPLLPLAWGLLVSRDISYPEAWGEWARPPWYLVALLLTPLPTLLFGLVAWRREGWDV